MVDYWSSVNFRTRLFPNYELQSISFSSTLHPQYLNEGGTKCPQADFSSNCVHTSLNSTTDEGSTMYCFASRVSVLLQLGFPRMATWNLVPFGCSPHWRDSTPVEKLVEMVLSPDHISTHERKYIVWSTANLEPRPPSLRVVNSVILFRF